MTVNIRKLSPNALSLFNLHNNSDGKKERSILKTNNSNFQNFSFFVKFLQKFLHQFK